MYTLSSAPHGPHPPSRENFHLSMVSCQCQAASLRDQGACFETSAHLSSQCFCVDPRSRIEPESVVLECKAQKQTSATVQTAIFISLGQVFIPYCSGDLWLGRELRCNTEIRFPDQSCTVVCGHAFPSIHYNPSGRHRGTTATTAGISVGIILESLHVQVLMYALPLHTHNCVPRVHVRNGPYKALVAP